MNAIINRMCDITNLSSSFAETISAHQLTPAPHCHNVHMFRSHQTQTLTGAGSLNSLSHCRRTLELYSILFYIFFSVTIFAFTSSLYIYTFRSDGNLALLKPIKWHATHSHTSAEDTQRKFQCFPTRTNNRCKHFAITTESVTKSRWKSIN